MYVAGQLVKIHSIPGMWTLGEPSDMKLAGDYVTVIRGGEGGFAAFVTYRYEPEGGVPSSWRTTEYVGCTGMIVDPKQLQAERDTAQSKVALLSSRVTELEDDFETVQEFMLVTIKEEQSWCDEGTRAVMVRLNEQLSGFQFQMPETWHEVAVEVTGSLTRVISLRVKAASLDDAKETVRSGGVDGLDGLMDEDEQFDYSSCDSVLTEAASSFSFHEIETRVLG